MSATVTQIEDTRTDDDGGDLCSASDAMMGENLRYAFFSLLRDPLCQPGKCTGLTEDKAIDIPDDVVKSMGYVRGMAAAAVPTTATASSLGEGRAAGDVDRGTGGRPPDDAVQLASPLTPPAPGEDSGRRPLCIAEQEQGDVANTEAALAAAALAARDAQQQIEAQQRCMALLRDEGDRLWMTATELAQERMVNRFNEQVLLLGSVNPALTDLAKNIVQPIISEGVTRLQRSAAYMSLMTHVLEWREDMVASYRDRRDIVRASFIVVEELVQDYTSAAPTLLYDGATLLEKVPDDVQIELIRGFAVQCAGQEQWQLFMSHCYPELLNDKDVTSAEKLLHYLKRKNITVASLYRHLRSLLMLDLCQILERGS